ncbi:MAG TPA: glycoside hydrolase family 43 protein [Verrucomicrobiae bacterium]
MKRIHDILGRCLYFWGWLTLVGLPMSVLLAAETHTFTNPIARSGADPWVTYHAGSYYYCLSHGGRGIYVAKSTQLTQIGQVRPTRVWQPPFFKAWSREIWAPELHYLQGKWYIYFAADDGENDHHRMYVLEGTTQNPQDPFTFKGKVAAPTDRWAIDGTVLQMPDERLYFIWSGWEGTNNVAQNLYIAPMSNPWTITGERVCLSRPEYDWEKKGEPLVNEGPETLWHGDKLFIIYSASGSWGDDYCLGQLAWTGGEVLDPHSWIKKPVPALAGTPQAISPGHCSFVKSRDGREDWIIYHTAKHPGAGWSRQIQTQPFHWAADGSPDFGRPVSAGTPLPLPGGELTLP